MRIPLRFTSFLLLIRFAAPAQEPDIVLRVTSRLVQVSVIAQDKHGKPVRDLTRDDFQLLDNKTQRQISVFSLETSEPAPPSAPTPPPNPLSFSNRTGRALSKVIAPTVVVIDGLNTDPDDFTYARVSVIEFLRKMHPGDPVALYMINGPQAVVVHDFTDDSTSLINAAREMQGVPELQSLQQPVLGVSAPAVRVGSDPHFAVLAGMLAAASQADAANLARFKADWTLTALEAIARHLAGIPGRKNFIWLGSGFPMNIGLSPGAFIGAEQKGVNQELYQYSDRVNRISRILSEAQVTVYPVDPGGVKGSSFYSAQTESQAGAAAIQSQQASGHMNTVNDGIEPGRATMRAVAKQTGGIAYFTNDVAENMRKAAIDGSISYTLGFYPSEADWDGKYHFLRISVTRPGIQIRSRTGYFAQSVKELEMDRHESLRMAVSSPLEGEAIGLTVTAASNPLQHVDQSLQISIDPRDIHFEEVNGKMHGSADVVLAQLTIDGRILKAEQKTLAFDLAPQFYQQGWQKGLPLSLNLQPAPSSARVRVVVRDAFSSAVGSVSLPFKPTN